MLITSHTVWDDIVWSTEQVPDTPFIMLKWYDWKADPDLNSLDNLLEAISFVEKQRGWKFVQVMGIDNLAIFRIQ